MSNFDPNAILRGAQLTLVGANRALQNPNLFTTSHYRQAAIAIILWLLSLFIDLDHKTWDDGLVDGLNFISKSVLQVPFFLMTIMSSVTPTLDNLFMDSLQWVDQTYVQKHKSDDPSQLRTLYYPTLNMYSGKGTKERKKSLTDNAIAIASRFGRRAAISLAIYAATFTPYVGRFVLPAASFYTFNKAVGPVPAAIVFGSGLLVPKRYMVSFLQTYFSSRSLMRQLLQPYFRRIRFTSQQKKIWFIDRSGVLFGFSAAFAVMVKVPLLGVLVYGIAEASTAYLITKITEPPPPPGNEQAFVDSQVRWKNKHLFLNLPMDRLDEFNESVIGGNATKSPVPQIPRQKFT
ncbi:hypothetical protein DV736_g933, partial [Chaetothyriales sp. CBS 134916]